MRNDYTLQGYRRQWASSTVYNDVASYLVGGQSAINTPDVSTTYYINSTSAQDTTAGTGVDTVRVTFLDVDGKQQTVTANLNGTTAVSIGAGYTFFQWMESDHSTQVNRVAAGKLTISSINGVATEATTMEAIRAGGDRSQSLRYKVPTGTHAHIHDYHASAVKLGGGSTNYEVQVRATVWADDGTLSNGFHFLRGAYLTDGETTADGFHFREIPAGAVIKMSVIPSATGDGNIITGTVDIAVIDDYLLA